MRIQRKETETARRGESLKKKRAMGKNVFLKSNGSG
jgi:hypothetical protein